MTRSSTNRFFSLLASSFPWRLAAPAGVAIAVCSTSLAGSNVETSDKVVLPEPGPVVEVCNWTGVYVGGNLGIAIAEHQFSGFQQRVTETVEPFPTVVQFGAVAANFVFDYDIPGRDDSVTSFAGGGQLGFNYQWGRWVFGVEGDFQSAELDATATFSQTQMDTDVQQQTIIDFTGTQTTEINTTLSSTRTVSSDWLASGRGRIGFAFGCLLVYATGGAAFTDLDLHTLTTISSIASQNVVVSPFDPIGVSGSRVIQSSQTFSGHDHDTVVGWTAGVGGEYAFNNRLSIGVEYRHSDFGSHDFVDFSTDQVMLKLNLRFAGLFRR